MVRARGKKSTSVYDCIPVGKSSTERTKMAYWVVAIDTQVVNHLEHLLENVVVKSSKNNPISINVESA